MELSENPSSQYVVQHGPSSIIILQSNNLRCRNGGEGGEWAGIIPCFVMCEKQVVVSRAYTTRQLIFMEICSYTIIMKEHHNTRVRRVTNTVGLVVYKYIRQIERLKAILGHTCTSFGFTGYFVSPNLGLLISLRSKFQMH